MSSAAFRCSVGLSPDESPTARRERSWWRIDCFTAPVGASLSLALRAPVFYPIKRDARKLAQDVGGARRNESQRMKVSHGVKSKPNWPAKQFRTVPDSARVISLLNGSWRIEALGGLGNHRGSAKQSENGRRGRRARVR